MLPFIKVSDRNREVASVGMKQNVCPFLRVSNHATSPTVSAIRYSRDPTTNSNFHNFSTKSSIDSVCLFVIVYFRQKQSKLA